MGVGRCRDALTQAFMSTDADWLLWIDTDQAFGPDHVTGLLRSADPDHRPVISGLYFGVNHLRDR